VKSVKKIVCNNGNIALKLQGEPVSILIVLVYMPALEYEDDGVEKYFGEIEKNLEENRKGEKNTS
jgi:hypothetical protein